MRSSIHALMAPDTVVVIGASARHRAMGNTVLRNFRQLDFNGRLYGVHPSETLVEGFDCFPSVHDLPETPDVAVIALRRDLVLEALRESAEAGARAAVVFASGLGETSDGTELAQEVHAMADSYGMSMTGPNCMGLVNVTTQTPLYSSALPTVMRPGGVAVVSQSGSGCIAMICSGRLEFSFVISAGNELVTNASDYLEYFVGDSHTRVIALIVETIRDPHRFAEAAARARTAGKPVIVLKAGRSDRGQLAAAAHTGALIAPADEYDAFFRRHGVVQVRDFDEMIESAQMFGAPGHEVAGRRVGFVSLSGGENALLLDEASRLSFDFPEFSNGTRDRIARALPDFASVSNPLDATGTAVFDKEMYREAIQAVESDPSVDFVGVIQDAPGALDPSHQESVAASLRVVADVAGLSDKPFAVLSNVGGSVHPAALEAIGEAVPILTGTREGLLAIDHFLRWSTADLPEATEPSALTRAVEIDWNASNSMDSIDAFALLESYNIPVARQRFVTDSAEALAAGAELGFPVAVKAVSGEILHKTERGLVHLDIRSEDELGMAMASLMGQVEDGATMVVQEMVQGVEVIVGARVSPTFGPLVLLGAGGIFVELVRSTAIGLAPFSITEALEMIDRTVVGDLLAGFRGAPPGDREALAKAVCDFSRLVSDLGGELSEMEINPLMVLPAESGVRAVDVIVTRRDD